MKTRLQIVALPSLVVGLLLSGSPLQAQWRVAPSALQTRWTKQVSPQNALPDYPRPQMARSRWQSLNGLWSYGLTGATSTTAPNAMSWQILVPYPYEAALSGIGKASPIAQKLWYKRTFSVPAAWRNQNVLLHFGAVNYDSTVMLNGRTLGSHKGGYDGFSLTLRRSSKRDRTNSSCRRRIRLQPMSPIRKSSASSASSRAASFIRARPASGKAYGWNRFPQRTSTDWT